MDSPNLYKDIVISLKPVYAKQIEEQMKPYEFRNFNTKFPIKNFYIYETSPSCCLAYRAEVGLPITFPDKIQNVGQEAERFNHGESRYKKAYRIEKLYKLTQPIPLKYLKERFNFTAPQSYFYVENSPILLNYLKAREWKEIF